MSSLDWLVIATYLIGMLLLAVYLGRRQASREDYYLGGHNLPGWALATSIIVPLAIGAAALAVLTWRLIRGSID